MKKPLILVLELLVFGCVLASLSSCSSPAKDVRIQINQEIHKLLPVIRERYKVYQEITRDAEVRSVKVKDFLRIGKRPRFRRLGRKLAQKHKYQYNHAANPMFAHVALSDLKAPARVRQSRERSYIRLSMRPWFESPERFVASMNEALTKYFRNRIYKKDLFMKILQQRYFNYTMPRYLFVLRTHRIRDSSLMITRNPRKVITAHLFKPGLFSGDVLMYDLQDKKLIGVIKIEVRSIQTLDPKKLESYNAAWFREELRQKVLGVVNSTLGDILH